MSSASLEVRSLNLGGTSASRPKTSDLKMFAPIKSILPMKEPGASLNTDRRCRYPLPLQGSPQEGVFEEVISTCRKPQKLPEVLSPEEVQRCSICSIMCGRSSSARF